MKKHLSQRQNFYLIGLFLFLGIFSSLAQPLEVISDGALISVYSDSVIIDGNFLHQNNDTVVNEGSIYLSGDWKNYNSNNNVFFTTLSNGPFGWVRLIGDTQIIGGTNTTNFNSLELSGTGTKKLDSVNTVIEDTLVLNTRVFDTGDSTVFVINSDTNAIFHNSTDAGGYICSTVNGGLSRSTLSTGNYSFPVGSNIGTPRYRPVDLRPNTASANTFKVRMANVNPMTDIGNAKDSALCDINPFFYHRIFHSTGVNPADIKIYFDAVTDGNFQTIAHWRATLPQQWDDLQNGLSSGGLPLSSVTRTGWTDFLPNHFALANGVPLPPTITAMGDTIFCSGDSVTLAADSGYTNYLWSNGATTQTIVVTTSGNYSVTVDNGGSCNASSANSVTILVNQYPVPNVTVIGDTSFCRGDSVTLVAESGFSSYLWSTGQTTPAITVNSTGNYTVSVVSPAGCIGSSSATQVTVNGSDPVITAIGATTFCQGQAGVTLDAGGGFFAYLWSNGDTTQTIAPDSSGNYVVSVTDINGCIGISQDSAHVISVNPSPNVTVSPDDTINLGASITLTASGAVTYEWIPGSGISDPEFSVSPTEETEYLVIGSDANGCKDTALVKISVDSECIPWLPNIFSPNGDGENEEFKLLGRGFELFYLTIFDRWGNIVFEVKDENKGWNGKLKNNGDLLNSGVYVYTLKYKCLSSEEEFEKHGNLTLTR